MNELLALVEKAPIDMSLEEILRLQLYAIEMNQDLEGLRNYTIDECISRLGGRYGAAATKDLQSLKYKK